MRNHKMAAEQGSPYVYGPGDGTAGDHGFRRRYLLFAPPRARRQNAGTTAPARNERPNR